MDRCPECGVSFARVDRVMPTWRKAWRDGPRFNELLGPVIWFITFGVLCLIGVAGTFTSPEIWPFVAALFVLGLLIWCASVARCIRRMEHTSALNLILLSHLVAILYVIIVPGFVAGAFILTMSIFTVEPALVLVGLTVLTVAFGSIIYAPKLEYTVAAACLKEQLRREVEQ